MPSPIAADGADTLIRIYATPRAGRSEIAGERHDAIWVRLAAPPVEGAANQALIELLADQLKLPKSAIRLQSGAAGRHKLVRVTGLSPDTVSARLRAAR
ncbi:MAG: DUF167 domain-containing protein [Chloroflexi bacterium]|nr:DUF167 domain-containing protein [Chloroflexota bacterium]